MYPIVKYLIAFVILGIPDTSNKHIVDPPGGDIIRGITMVAPPEEFSTDPISSIKAVNADWIAVVPYGYNRKGNPEVRFNSPWQWWGERPEGVRESIKSARRQGLNVMIKPQVYIHGSWVGEVDFESEADWKIWEESYKNYVMAFVNIAIEEGVEMICIGTEYKIAAQKREKYWRQLIRDVRKIYTGKIIYSSNWDGYRQVPFWDALDFIGISAYFPLTSKKTPAVNLLKREWKPIISKLKKFSVRQGKKIIFTEYGYLSVDGCAHKAWELEKQIQDLSVNEKAQANAYQALLDSFWDQDYWAGGFLWKWFPNMQGHEGYPAKDYTPQGKIAEQVIKDWYGK